MRWLALMWQDLERIQERHPCPPFSADAMMLVRLEILLMEQAAARCLARGDLGYAEHTLISELLADLRALLDPRPGISAADPLGLIHAAQDRIFDEALAVRDTADHRHAVRHSSEGRLERWQPEGQHGARVG